MEQLSKGLLKNKDTAAETRMELLKIQGRKCNKCGCSVALNHILEDDRISKMSNSDKIIAPRCKKCFNRLTADAGWHSEDNEQSVILITGLCGAGKSSIGKMLEQKLGFVHIDGDAVSKRVNWDIQ